MSKTGVEGQLIQAINWWLPGGSVVKNPPANAEGSGWIPGSGRSLEKEIATHCGIFAWEIPWTEEPGGLQSLG